MSAASLRERTAFTSTIGGLPFAVGGGRAIAMLCWSPSRERTRISVLAPRSNRSTSGGTILVLLTDNRTSSGSIPLLWATPPSSTSRNRAILVRVFQLSEKLRSGVRSGNPATTRVEACDMARLEHGQNRITLCSNPPAEALASSQSHCSFQAFVQLATSASGLKNLVSIWCCIRSRISVTCCRVILMAVLLSRL